MKAAHANTRAAALTSIFIQVSLPAMDPSPKRRIV
jgi:hypothetical protein